MTQAIVKKPPCGSLTGVETINNIDHIRVLLDLQGEEVDVLNLAQGNMVMICQGPDDCIYRATCGFCDPNSPLQPPQGSYCPLEIVYLQKMYLGYKGEMCPDGANWSLMCLIKDVSALELQIMRSERMLAENGAVVELVAVGVDKSSGRVVERPEVTAKLEAFQKLLKEKLRFMEQMGLTPKARAQIGATVTKDPSTYAAETLAKFEEIMRRRQKERASREMGVAYVHTDGGKSLPPAGDVIDVQSPTGTCDAVGHEDGPSGTYEQGAGPHNDDGQKPSSVSATTGRDIKESQPIVTGVSVGRANASHDDTDGTEDEPDNNDAGDGHGESAIRLHSPERPIGKTGPYAHCFPTGCGEGDKPGGERELPGDGEGDVLRTAPGYTRHGPDYEEGEDESAADGVTRYGGSDPPF